MDGLPQELIDQISSHLPKQDLHNVLTLSCKFRYAAERHSGAFAEFTVNESNAAEFLVRFSNHRLLYLREVKFRPAFPTLYDTSDNEDDNKDDSEVLCRESAHEVQKRDESLTRQIQFLFHTLQVVEKQAGGKHAPGRYRLSVYGPIRTIDAVYICPHRYLTSWRVRLLATKLPPIASIRSFEIYNNDDHEPRGYYVRDMVSGVQEFKLDLRVLIDLAVRMPNLEYLGLRTGGHEWCETLNEEEDTYIQHYERDWEGPRRDARHDFAAAVIHCVDDIPKTLRRASLDFLNPLDRAIEIHHDRPLPDLVGPLAHDPFTSSLGILCSNLRHLQLRAMVDENLFPRPPQNFTALHTPWPHLELLEIMLHNARPDGTWYFSGPEGQGNNARGFPITHASYPPYVRTQLDEQMDDVFLDDHYNSASIVYHTGNSQFRVAPHANLTRLLERFARAAIHMPALKEAVIWSPLNWQITDDRDAGIDYWTKNGEEDDYIDEMAARSGNLAWGIAYAEPGRRANTSSCRRLEWLVGPWRPDGELHGLFQEIGRTKHGEELEELWTADVTGDEGIGFRDWFEDSMMFGVDMGCVSVTH